MKFLCSFSTALSQPSGQCPLLSQRPIRNESSERKSLVKIRYSHFCHLLSWFFYTFYFLFLFFINLSSLSLTSLSHLLSLTVFSSPVSPPSMLCSIFTPYVPMFFPQLFHLVNSVSWALVESRRLNHRLNNLFL